MKLQLVENWKDGWKWLSTQSMALSVAILSSWEVVPAEWKAALPTDNVKYWVIGLLIFGIVGRFLNQTKEA